ncbi:MAG: potassium channel family protein [Thermoplasmata archaeon]
MAISIFFFRSLRKFMRNVIYRAALFALIVVTYGSVSEYILQNNVQQSGIHSMFESLWWTMQTVTTVGYGDVTIYGTAARVNAMVVMILGIGSIGLFTASLATVFVDSRISRKLGEVRLRMKEHIIVCNFDSISSETIRRIAEQGNEIAILSNEPVSFQHENVFYIKGSCLEPADLERAGISRASKAIVFSGKIRNDEDPTGVDARSILSGMEMKKQNPEIYVIAELYNPNSEMHAIEVGIDETITRGNVSSLLIYNSIMNPGVSKLLYKILGNRKDEMLGEEPVDKDRYTRYDALYNDYESRGKLVLAVVKDREIQIRPPKDAATDCDRVIFLNTAF